MTPRGLFALSFSSRGIAHTPQSFGIHQSVGKTHEKFETFREIFLQMKLSKSVLLASVGLSSQFSFGQITVRNISVEI